VALARAGRLWDFYAPVQMARLDVNEGRPVPASIAGLVFYYCLLLPAAVGVVVLRRRRTVQWPLLVPAGVLTLVAVVDYGLVRFRAPFEVSLVVLAAVALDAVWRRLVGRRARPAGSLGAPLLEVEGEGEDEVDEVDEVVATLDSPYV
jgi:hypothetical protein